MLLNTAAGSAAPQTKSRIDLFVPPIYVNKETKSTSLHKTSLHNDQVFLLDKHRHSIITSFQDDKLKIRFLDKGT
ncbi:MAG: hypothetical protein HRT47_08415 [Candidatus Caenarcaniphilales bacterium]|nr:hypothetical protein [Candidatus Caenarcaniphilales bacterium]